jgi:hypothetical protein
LAACLQHGLAVHGLCLLACNMALPFMAFAC